MGNQLFTARPVILLENQEDPFVSAAFIRFEIKLNLNGQGDGELEFTNWGVKNNSVGYLFFDDPRLENGKTVQIKVGQAILQGQINERNPHFPRGSAPTLSLFLKMNPASNSGLVNLSYGQALLEFDVIETRIARGNPGASRVGRRLLGKGTTNSQEFFAPGLKVDLQGIGARYSGEYTLSEVIYNFQIASGLEIQFQAERAV